MAFSPEEEKELREVDIEKYFHKCMNGGEAFRVLELMLERWDRMTGDELFQTLMSSMYTSEGTSQDWALSIKEMLEGRKNGNRSYMSRWDTEKMEGSCNCSCMCTPKKENV